MIKNQLVAFKQQQQQQQQTKTVTTSVQVFKLSLKLRITIIMQLPVAFAASEAAAPTRVEPVIYRRFAAPRRACPMGDIKRPKRRIKSRKKTSTIGASSGC